MFPPPPPTRRGPAPPPPPRMDRPHWNFVDAFPSHFLEWKGAPVVSELSGTRVLPQGKVVVRPESVANKRPRVRMACGLDPEEIINLPLNPGRGIAKRRER